MRLFCTCTSKAVTFNRSGIGKDLGVWLLFVDSCLIACIIVGKYIDMLGTIFTYIHSHIRTLNTNLFHVSVTF